MSKRRLRLYSASRPKRLRSGSAAARGRDPVLRVLRRRAAMLRPPGGIEWIVSPWPYVLDQVQPSCRLGSVRRAGIQGEAALPLENLLLAHGDRPTPPTLGARCVDVLACHLRRSRIADREIHVIGGGEMGALVLPGPPLLSGRAPGEQHGGAEKRNSEALQHVQPPLRRRRAGHRSSICTASGRRLAWPRRTRGANEDPTERLQLSVHVRAAASLALAALLRPRHLLPPTLNEPAVVEYFDVTLAPKFSEEGLVERWLVSRHDEQHH